MPPSTQLPPLAQRLPSFDARDYTPEIEATIERSRLSKQETFVHTRSSMTKYAA
jgi:hypothetical protein